MWVSHEADWVCFFNPECLVKLSSTVPPNITGLQGHSEGGSAAPPKLKKLRNTRKFLLLWLFHCKHCISFILKAVLFALFDRIISDYHSDFHSNFIQIDDWTVDSECGLCRHITRMIMPFWGKAAHACAYNVLIFDAQASPTLSPSYENFKSSSFLLLSFDYFHNQWTGK